MPNFSRSSAMPASAEDVYAWHSRAGAFERLSPPWQDVRVVSRTGGIETPGSRVSLSVPLGPLRRRWVSEHHGAVPGREFRDRQVEGPFAVWEHHHRFVPETGSRSILEDEIHYELPFGGFAGGSYVRGELERLFAYRHEITSNDLSAHGKYTGKQRMRILVTGASGLVGSQLGPFLTTGGHSVVALRRGSDWDLRRGYVDEAALEGFDAVVHLAGESIASGRWTAARKERIRSSRVTGTRLVSEALARMENKPRVLVSASAIGYYGDRGDELLTEDSESGEGFLASVCRDWEAATDAASQAGIRVVHLRTGIVLSPKGGALAKMLTPFRMGAGGVIGTGNQYMSWIAIDDLVGVIHDALMEDEVVGPVNAVAPHPVTNRDFTKTLGRVLARPTLFPLPGFAAKLAMGEMAEELLLASTRVESKTKYGFLYPELEPALRHLLGR